MKRALLIASACLPLVAITRLQLENADDCPALVVHQTGNSTAAVIQSDTDNPALKLISTGNAAALEVVNLDGEDGVTCVECDFRGRHGIFWRSCIALGGALQFAGFDDPLEFHDVMKLGPAEEIMLGNPERGNSVRVRVDGGVIDFEAGGSLIMRIQGDGIRVKPGSIREDL